MPSTKQYLRYIPVTKFGVIGSQKSPIQFLDASNTCIVGACQNVIIWNLKISQQVNLLSGDKHEVTMLSTIKGQKQIAVGYNDGTVNVFDAATGDVLVTFKGHNSSISAMCFNSSGFLLASGAKDTNIVLWDIINESGLYRLKGHKGEITHLSFFPNKNFLVSSSKDMTIKFWDLSTQHCFKTLVGHRTEIYTFCLIKEGTTLLTGSGDSELRVFNIEYLHEDDDAEIKKQKMSDDQDDVNLEDENKTKDRILRLTPTGSLMRKGKGRVVSLAVDQSNRYIACHGVDRIVEIYQINSREEIQTYRKKKLTKLKRKNRDTDSLDDSSTLKHEISPLCVVKTEAKPSSLDLYLQPGHLKMCVLLTNNSIQNYTIDVTVKPPVVSSLRTIAHSSHRTDVRTLTFSSDNTAFLTASAEGAKIWNRSSLKCIQTVNCDYALCSLFAPGDRHFIIGTKSGRLQLFDVGSGDLLDDVEAHTSSIWSLSLMISKKGFISGSADHSVKFWNFELRTNEESDAKTRRLSMSHVRTLQMDEDVLCVKFSGNDKLLAVGLLDNTVKIFFTDTLKFFLSLYGHKLPVLCLDISTDSTLIATGSADKNIKIWGLDFGDCHKSIFAHDDSITCLQFIPNTHMFFTGSKDGLLKQWDADNFQHIITLKAHFADIWALAVTTSGKFVITASHDKSLHLWEKSQEPLVLSEEREMERETEQEQAVADNETVLPGEVNEEVGLAGKKNMETVKASEKIMEALDLYDEELEKFNQHKNEQKTSKSKSRGYIIHPLMAAFGVSSPDMYMLEVLRRVKLSELEQSLLVLPFTYTTRLLVVLEKFLISSNDVELINRYLLFLLRVHHGQITSNQMLLPVIESLRRHVYPTISRVQDVIGTNLAGLRYLQDRINERDEYVMFTDATERAKIAKKRKKRKILSIKVV